MSELNFIEVDSAAIYQTVMDALENGVSEPLYPGDERRIFGESFVPLVVSIYNALNDACRQKMLRYARGDTLDALGENLDCKRVDPAFATCTLKFSIGTAIATNIVIPAGVRVTSDWTRYFETDETVVLAAGSTHVTVGATATEGGAAYNDIAIGEIKTIVDTSEVPLVDAVTNETATGGGAEKESDEAYRERIRNADAATTTAGPAKAYRYWAIAASPLIADAVVENETRSLTRELTVYNLKGFKGGNNLLANTLKVYAHGSTTPATVNTDYTAEYADNLLTITLTAGGTLASAQIIDIEIDETQEGSVIITPMCYGGAVPSQTLLNAVLASCSQPDVRPLTDTVKVQAPTVRTYDIELVYWTTAAEESACVETVEGDGGAIDRYVFWQGESLKRDINPDYLKKLILSPDWDSTEALVGATRVIITAPTYTDLDATTIAQFSGNLTVSHIVKEGVNG